MHNIVSFVWKGERAYTVEHAAILFAGLKKTMSENFMFTVITDDAPPMSEDGFKVMPLPEEARRVAKVRTPENAHFPSSYRRLWLFSEEARDVFGSGRVMLTDVDVITTEDWAPLFNYRPDAEFVGWDPGTKWGSDKRLAGGQWLLEVGSHTELWDRFVEDPTFCKNEARQAGFRGSDQAWISYMLAGDVPVWPSDLGIRSIQDLTRGKSDKKVEAVPSEVRAVHFKGKNKPWDEVTQRENPWLKNHLPDFCKWFS